jgi:hypothetical protein
LLSLAYQFCWLFIQWRFRLDPDDLTPDRSAKIEVNGVNEIKSSFVLLSGISEGNDNVVSVIIAVETLFEHDGGCSAA